MNLLLLEAGEETAPGCFSIEGPRVVHIEKVLGLSPGASLRVGLVNGPKGTGVLESLEGNHATISCTWMQPACAQPNLDLVLAMPRPRALQRMLSPLAQLGVGRLYLSNAYKVERSYFDSHVLVPQSLRTELLSGMAQARTTYLPQVSLHHAFAWLLQHELVRTPTTRLLVAEPGLDFPKATALASDQHTVLFVGPEGGFAPREQQALFDAGAELVTLGDRSFRSDLATYLLVSQLRGVSLR